MPRFPLHYRVLCIGQSFQQPGGFVRRVVPGEFGLHLARPLAVTQLGQHLFCHLVDLLRRALVGLEATGTSSSTSASRKDAISSSAFVAAVYWVPGTMGRSASTLSSHQADNPESMGSSGRNAATKFTCEVHLRSAPAGDVGVRVLKSGDCRIEVEARGDKGPRTSWAKALGARAHTAG